LPTSEPIGYTSDRDERVRNVCSFKAVTAIGLSDSRQTSRGTSTSNYSGTNTTTVPDTPDIITARADRAQIDPSIGYRLGEKERQLKESFVNPTGGYVTPAIRDAIMRSGQRELMSQAGEQAREGTYDANRLNMQRNLALAGLTRGTVGTQSGTQSGTTSGTVTQGQSPFATALGIGTSLAPISL
jgi:hypothetical protein